MIAAEVAERGGSASWLVTIRLEYDTWAHIALDAIFNAFVCSLLDAIWISFVCRWWNKFAFLIWLCITRATCVVTQVNSFGEMLIKSIVYKHKAIQTQNNMPPNYIGFHCSALQSGSIDYPNYWGSSLPDGGNLIQQDTSMLCCVLRNCLTVT